MQDVEGKGAKLELTYYHKKKNFTQAAYEDRIFDHIALHVSDMEETISKLRKEKVTITDEPFKLKATGSLIAFIEDPDGTLIELNEKKQA